MKFCQTTVLLAARSLKLSLLPMLLFMVVDQAYAQITPPDRSWPARTPAEVGLESEILDQFISRVGGTGVIIKDGYMVQSWGSGNHGDWASASKPVYSTLLFFAIHEGKIPHVDTLIKELNWNLIAKDQTMTFHHLANMISGYARGELSGAAWAYNDYAIMLYLQSLLDRVYDVDYTDADAVLSLYTDDTRLGPLQFQDGSLFKIVKNVPRVNMTPRDFARIGWFWLNRGNWSGRQLLPEIYFDSYMKPNVSSDIPLSMENGTDYLNIGTMGGGSFQNFDGRGMYGYNWWFNNVRKNGVRLWPDAPSDTIASIGHNGLEVMVVIPSANMVVAARGHWGDIYDSDGMNYSLDLLSKAVLSTTTSEPSSPISRLSTTTPEPSLPIGQGRIIVNPANPRWFAYDRDENGDGKLDPFYWVGAGGPEDFLYRGSKNPDGTRNGDQTTIIDAIAAGGGNGIYVQMIRSHGGDGPSDHNPFINNDRSQGLNEAILNQWDAWFTDMESKGIIVLLFFYDDAADLYQTRDIVDIAEQNFIHTIVNRFEHHSNLVWAVAEEYEEVFTDNRVSGIAAVIRVADDYDRPIGVHHATGDNTMNFPDDLVIDQFAHQSNATSPEELYDAVSFAFNDANGRFNVTMAENWNEVVNDHPAALKNGDRTDARLRNWAVGMAGGYVLVMGAWEEPRGGIPSSEMLADWGQQKQFFESTNFDEMLPADDLKADGTQYLLAKPGQSYIAYASNLQGDIGIQSMVEGQYLFQWFDPTSGHTITEIKTVESGTHSWSKPSEIGSELAIYINRIE